jgi:hypothetical protein
MRASANQEQPVTTDGNEHVRGTDLLHPLLTGNPIMAAATGWRHPGACVSHTVLSNRDWALTPAARG